MTGTESIMILLPSPRHRKDGSPHDGGGKNLCVQPSTVYIAAQCRGSSVKYGKFKSEHCAALYAAHVYGFSSEKERFFDERS